MATKKKSKSKSSPQPKLKRHVPVILFVLALFSAYLLGKAQPFPVHPKSLVWAAANDVRVPVDLISFLEAQPNCVDSEGRPKEDGVNLWSVFKVSQGKFAKLAYGCSYDLSFYKMAVKQDGDWKLLDTKTYLANSFLPKCSEIDKYQIDKTIEPFCLEETGASRENPILAN